MKSNRIRCVFSVLCNLAVIGLTAWSVLCFFFGDRIGDGNMAVMGTGCFRYFTIDSNILASFCCLFVLFYTVPGMFQVRVMLPSWVSSLKMTGTAAVTVTLLTVLCFLGPSIGYGPLLEGNNLFLHLINPLLCLLSFIFFETGEEIQDYRRWIGMIPVAVYGCVYLIMVVSVGYENGGWADFYGFNKGNLWYVTVVAMAAASFIISVSLHAARNAFCSRTVDRIYNLK